MTEPGSFLATGRAADVFDQGDCTVLRRYRTDHNSEMEARVMTWLRDNGIAVPRVHSSDGRDIVMDLVSGPTMLEDLERHPWRIISHARQLANLQKSVNKLVAPEWFPHSNEVPAGRSVLHRDLHPMNVILGPSRPVIIDWTNATAGDHSFDAAMSYALMATFEVSGARDRIGQRLLVESFAQFRGRSIVQTGLAAACRVKLSDPHTTPGEVVALQRLFQKAGGGPSCE